jgi:hypothetical protein
MPFVRTSWLLLTLALVLEGCSCGRAPVNNVLKPEGEACATDEECESSLCDQLPGKPKVCFRKCATVCKPGDVCTSLAVGDRYACVPEKPGLCQGCELNTDCPYPGDRCVELGGTKVCARDCAFDGQCPASYRCADATDTTGAYAPKQCQPTSGTCDCIASTAGQTVPCSETNSFGTCTGVKTCRPPNGYDACSAPVPTAETCNGRDDDCNGMTDENLGETVCGEGECKRTVSNCINGSPQRCEAGTPTTEICDGKDNDCNGSADDGIDTKTSLQHCGACNSPCAPPNTVPLCTNGVCGFAQCLPGWSDADGIVANGCEYPCTPTNGGVEICDGVDNNCNGLKDEGFTLATDPLNCGVCGRVCNVNNGNVATYACVAGQCAIATCVQAPTKYDDCDQVYLNGCELNVSTSLTHCGGCNVPCAVANGTPQCVAGTCRVQQCTPPWDDCNQQVADGCETNLQTTVAHCGACNSPCPMRANAAATCLGASCGFQCNPGWVDLDGLGINGCEYMCAVTGPDAPELLFLDSNCDGVDGDASRAIFVATTGNDTSPGTRTQPKLTIGAAILAADAASPKKDVYVSKGTYAESVTLRSGVGIFGGYDATANWSRAATNLTTIDSPGPVAVTGSSLGLAAELQLLTIRSANATGTEANGDGRSSIGVRIVDSPAGLTIRACDITAGAGATGGAGSNGSVGTVGATGSNAGTGGRAVAGGGAAGAACGVLGNSGGGGSGGTGVSGVADGRTGTAGSAAPQGGAGGAPGSFGGRGQCGGTSSQSGGDAPTVLDTGTAGDRGSHGAAPAASGSFSGGLFTPASGQPGGPGRPGGGGGGGGSGGGSANGESVWDACSCTSLQSGGGGGGGSGGCGGTGGTGGRGGGGSFAVISINSNVQVEATKLTSASGGRGGNGGSGGTGGSGGQGGTGADGQVRDSACSNRRAGNGARGGTGGSGGRGGGGSGGAGGPSHCIAWTGMMPSNTGNTCATAAGGQGGTGGTNGLDSASTGPIGLNNQYRGY